MTVSDQLVDLIRWYLPPRLDLIAGSAHNFIATLTEAGTARTTAREWR